MRHLLLIFKTLIISFKCFSQSTNTTLDCVCPEKQVNVYQHMSENSIYEDYPFQKYLRSNLSFPINGTDGYVYVKVDVLGDSTVALELLKGYGSSKDEVFRVLNECPKNLIGHYRNMDFILPVLFADNFDDCFYISLYRCFNDVWILPAVVVLGNDWMSK